MGKKKVNYLSVVYNDFMLSLLATKQSELEKGITYQIPLEPGIVKDGLIENEDELYFVLKDYLKKLKIKNHTVRLVAPSQNVLMKKINVPEAYTTSEEIRQFVDEEIQQSIHLPFDEPQIDLYDEDVTDGLALLFATEQEEVTEIVHLFEDLGHFPEVVDIKILADLRIVQEVFPNFNEQTNLVLDWSMGELRMAIVERGNVELIKAFKINTTIEDWTINNEEPGIVSYTLTANKGAYEQEIAHALSEIDKVVHFYQFSLNKGSKEVQQVLIIGDHPMLNDITEIITTEVPLPVVQMTDELIDSKFPTYHAKHSTLLGLTMKGVSNE